MPGDTPVTLAVSSLLVCACAPLEETHEAATSVGSPPGTSSGADFSSAPFPELWRFPCPTSEKIEPCDGLLCSEVQEEFFYDGLPYTETIILTDASGFTRQIDHVSDTSSSRTSLVYNTANLVLAQAYDGLTDGEVDSCVRWTYAGLTVTEEWDQGADGTTDSWHLSTYDVAGNLLRYEAEYYDYLSVLDYYTYDSENRMLTSWITNPDNGWTGGYPISSTFAYNPEGLLSLTVEDFSDDGTSDKVHTFAYDSQGNMLQEEVDWAADEIIDTRYTYAYDSDGNLVEFVSDYDVDEEFVDHRWTYLYDDDGNLLTEVHKDGAGVLEEVFIHTYDANGDLVERVGVYGYGNLFERITYDFSCRPT